LLIGNLICTPSRSNALSALVLRANGINPTAGKSKAPKNRVQEFGRLRTNREHSPDCQTNANNSKSSSVNVSTIDANSASFGAAAGRAALQLPCDLNAGGAKSR
jgi:hypothetical protein